MSYTWEDFEKDYTREHLHLLPQEDLLKVLTLEAGVETLFSPGTSKGLLQKDLPLEAIEELLSKDRKK